MRAQCDSYRTYPPNKFGARAAWGTGSPSLCMAVAIHRDPYEQAVASAFEVLGMPKKTLEQNRIVDAVGGDVPTNNGARSIVMQMPYRASVTVQGVAPIIFHRYDCDSVETKAAAKKGSREKKTDDIDSYVYRDADGDLCLPAEYLQSSITGAARYLQDPRSPRKSAMDLYKAGIVVITPLVKLGTKAWDYVDKRPVVVQRSRVPRSRPAMNPGWRGTFVVMVNLPQYITPDDLNEVISNAGKFCGFGDYRPTYGRFQVVEFEVLDD